MRRPAARTVQCTQCGRDYRAIAVDARFCSMKCAADSRPILDIRCLVCGDTFQSRAPNAAICSDTCSKRRARETLNVRYSKAPAVAFERRIAVRRQTYDHNGATLSRGSGDASERRTDCRRVNDCLGVMHRAFGADAFLSCAACPVRESTTAMVREESGLNGHRRRE